MGSCLSKKGSRTTSTPSCASATVAVSAPPLDPNKCGAQVEKKAVEGEEESVKKEIFVIKHRKNHETRPEEKGGVTCTSEATQICNKTTIATATSNNVVTNGGGGSSIDIAGAVRTSSGTKEEVDAILIQCGKLSRSSSGSYGGRKYSGSKRSYDFDQRDNDGDSKKGSGIEENEYEEYRRSRASSHGRRRTPGGEREQRSASRDRGSSGNGGGRRMSRSPGRRSEAAATTSSRPGKMVSVPATVSSLVMDKSNNGSGAEPATTAATIKRVSVKRNVGEARSSASPRSQSPAKPRVSNENQNAHPLPHQQPSLSRSSSRKAERSPYRRNPLNEIDTNSLAIFQPPSNKTANNFASQKPNVNVEETNNCKKVVQETNNMKSNSRGTQENKVVTVGCRAKEQQIENKGLQPKSSYVELTRSRSSRRSRDLDLNPEALLNPTASYTTLLLEDIQNFHQKSNNTSFSLPPCVTKACSILEAVADLNSCTSSNLSCAFSEDRQSNNNPFLESELVVGDDIMEPSLHKYVTVRRGTEMEEQESSGSNTFVFVGAQQHWEPNSADSTDRWTSSPLALSQSGRHVDEAPRRFSAKKRDSDHQHAEITHGRVGASRATLAAAASA